MVTTLKHFLLASLMITLFSLSGMPSQAQAIISNNRGAESKTWTITGEPTLVINGFDLSQVTSVFPVTISAVSIDIARAVPGQPVGVVIYEDPNGGSPVDARFIHKTDTTIDTTGLVTIPLREAVNVNSPVIWVGFYLPIQTRFKSDQQGSSVLTYWAWNPGGLLDIVNLGAAQVLGPSDGSAPANLNLGGVARINFTMTSAGGRSVLPNGEPLTIGEQMDTANAAGDTSVMREYATCPGIFFDPADIDIIANGSFSLHCRVEYAPYSPGRIQNAGDFSLSVASVERRGPLYYVFPNGDYKANPADSARFVTPVTHCMRPPVTDLEQAVLGVAYGAPMAWEILPTVRVNDWICAELPAQGPISYFMPLTGQEQYGNLNLFFAQTPTFSVFPPKCKQEVTLTFFFHNEGFEASRSTSVRIENIAVRTGAVTLAQEFSIKALEAGTSVTFTAKIRMPDSFVNEANRLIMTIDPRGEISEFIETDNVKIFDYILKGC